jgi:type IV pilus assembly protein PilP
MKAIIAIFFLSFSLSALSAGNQKIYRFLKNKTTKIKNPFELRDPFKRDIPKRARTNKGIGDRYGSKFSNIPELEEVPLDNIRIVGIVLGNEKRALARISASKGGALGPEIYTLKEGMRIGLNDAEIKIILPGGIVVVEKIVNVYDQDEYLETIIPISE